MLSSKSLLIGIDGNEANIAGRVGVNQFALGLLRGLWEISTPHQFVIYLSTSPLPTMPKEKPNWHYRVIGPSKFWTQWRLPLDLFTASPKPDVFFSPSHYAPRFSPVPTVISIMDIGFLDSPRQFTKKDYFQLKNWTAYSVRQAKNIITISEFSKRDLIRKYNIPARSIEVVYPGFDRDLFHPRNTREVTEILKRYKFTHPYILYLGSLKPSKNIVRLVEAFAKITHPHGAAENYQLVIAGKRAWLYDEIFAKVQELGLAEKVIFTGFFPEEDVPYLISGAAVFTSPSLFEGFGIPVVEAMASGTPVVVSKVASLPEVAGRAGIFVDPLVVKDIAAGLTKVLKANGLEKERMRAAGQLQAQKFSWQTAAEKTMKVLEDTALN